MYPAFPIALAFFFSVFPSSKRSFNDGSVKIEPTISLMSLLSMLRMRVFILLTYLYYCISSLSKRSCISFYRLYLNDVLKIFLRNSVFNVTIDHSSLRFSFQFFNVSCYRIFARFFCFFIYRSFDRR